MQRRALVTPGLIYGDTLIDEIQAVNKSRTEIVVIMSSDKLHRQLRGGNVEIAGGVGGAAGKIGFELQDGKFIHQVKSIAPGSTTTFTVKDETCYMTAVRQRSTGAYSVFRVDSLVEKGTIWTATDEMVFAHGLDVQKSFMEQFTLMALVPPAPPAFMMKNLEHVPESLSGKTDTSCDSASKPLSIDDLLKGIRLLSAADRAEFGRRLFSELKV